MCAIAVVLHLRRFAYAAVLLAAFCSSLAAQRAAAAEPSPPKVGQQAPDFALPALDGEKVKLSGLTKKGPVVLMVLRGFPGYQCPICTRQVGQFLGVADELRNAGAAVVMVYPGPENDLLERAKEFMGDKSLPAGFHLVIDPGYEFTTAYHLRWKAPRETAYPSTFIIGRDRTVRFAEISKTHGGRTPASEVLKALKNLNSEE